MGPAGSDELARWAQLKVAPLRASLGALRASAAKAALLRRWRAQLAVAAARGLAEMLAAGRRPPAPALPPDVAALWEAL